MSVDQSDVSAVVKQNQQAIGQSMWPILLDPKVVNYQLNAEAEVTINPCDHIWLPTMIDPALFNNSDFANVIVNGWEPSIYGSGGLALLANGGANTFPINDYSGTAPPVFAPVVALRFNSMNNPYTFWSLGSWPLLIGGDGGASGPIAGMGAYDSMRSISGVITRMWVKWLAFSNIETSSGAGYGTASKLLLMSAMGYNETTVGQSSQTGNLGADSTSANAPGVQTSVTTFSGGGYQTPQMNTVQRLALEAAGLKGAVTTAASDVVATLRKI